MHSSSGAVLSAIPVTTMQVMAGCTQAPAFRCPQFPASDRVYDPVTNSVHALPMGELLWQVPMAVSQDTGVGAIAGPNVVFEAGHQIVVAAGP